MSKPCDTCPYRRSTPVGVWDDREYENLREQNTDPLMGRVFGCHLYRDKPAAERVLCAGWLADQKRRGTPSIQLRVLLLKDEAARALFEAVNENDPDLYDSIDEMVAANRNAPFPEDPEIRKKILRKLARKPDFRRFR